MLVLALKPGQLVVCTHEDFPETIFRIRMLHTKDSGIQPVHYSTHCATPERSGIVLLDRTTDVSFVLTDIWPDVPGTMTIGVARRPGYLGFNAPRSITILRKELL